MNCTSHPILIGLSNKEEWDRQGTSIWHERETGEMHTGFRPEDLMERHHLEDLCVDGRIILQWIFKKWNGEAWTGLIWFRIRTVEGGAFECSNDLTGSIKCGNFLTSWGTVSFLGRALFHRVSRLWLAYFLHKFCLSSFFKIIKH